MRVRLSIILGALRTTDAPLVITDDGSELSWHVYDSHAEADATLPRSDTGIRWAKIVEGRVVFSTSKKLRNRLLRAGATA